MSEVIADLHVRYPNFELNVSLRLPGEGISVLFGPSGCGKTTVLRALAGLEKAQGRVLVQNQIWQDDSLFLPTHKRPIGYVVQETSLFPHLTVQGNLDYGFKRIPVAERRISVDEAVALLGIAHLLSRKPDRLSGGERQRVGIARALLTSPRLLLMDEPLSALDAARKAEILPYLERLAHDAAIPVVYVTHALDEAARLANHLVLMDAGCVITAGQAETMLARLDLPFSQVDEAAAILDATVVMHDAAYGQSQLDVAGLPLWAGWCTAAMGQHVRIKVLARDVSVSLSQAQDSSISNILPAHIMAIRADGADTVMLQLGLCDPTLSDTPQVLLARLTRRSYESLQLKQGQRVFAQIKGVALM